MALIQGQIIPINSRIIQMRWLGVTENDTCIALQSTGYADRSVQVVGTFSGGTVQIQGSEDNSHFGTLKDNLGNALSYTAVSTPTPIASSCLWIAPLVSGGSGNSIDILITCNSSGE